MEGTPEIEPDKVESKINPHLDRSPINTETGMENIMSRITGERVAYQEETGNRKP